MPRRDPKRGRRRLEVHELTAKRWPDLERLFGPGGAYSGCWCMWWRVSRAEFSKNGNDGNRRALKSIVDSQHVPGLIGYLNGDPVGWISIDRRENYASLERSRTLKRVDDRPVWSIVCFFVGKGHRRQGVQRQLLEAALDYARARGARTLEAYPPRRWQDPASNYMGLASQFERAGFRAVGPGSRVMRRSLRPRRRPRSL